jgi:hypothetical protein
MQLNLLVKPYIFHIILEKHFWDFTSTVAYKIVYVVGLEAQTDV